MLFKYFRSNSKFFQSSFSASMTSARLPAFSIALLRFCYNSLISISLGILTPKAPAIERDAS